MRIVTTLPAYTRQMRGRDYGIFEDPSTGERWLFERGPYSGVGLTASEVGLTAPEGTEVVHKQFARIVHGPGLDEARALDFARRFGLLGWSTEIETHEERLLGEPVSSWEGEAIRMNVALRSWELADGTRSLREMNQHLEGWGIAKAERHLALPGRGSVMAGYRLRSPTLLERSQFGVPYRSKERASKHLRELAYTLANDGIRGWDAQGGIRAAPMIVADGDMQGSVELIARNLAGLLWLECARTFSGQYEERTCKWCGEPMALGGERGTNRKRETCSDTCRQKLHQQRRKHALALHADGMKPGAIAREVGSNTQTVSGWLRAARAKKGSRRGK